MTCRRGDGVPADASPGLDAIDATLHTNHGRKHNSTQVDFPVIFWRGHLEAFRRHVVRHVLKEDYSPQNWWRAVAELLRRGWRPSEYSNLMGFAMQRSRCPVV